MDYEKQKVNINELYQRFIEVAVCKGQRLFVYITLQKTERSGLAEMAAELL